MKLLLNVFIWGIFILSANAQQAPFVICDEDFTDGKFDNINAGINGKNWAIYSDVNGISFTTPNNRGFSQALIRKLSLGGYAWAGAQYRIWNDLNNNGKIDKNTELQKFYVDKKEDVLVLKFRAFSDVARKPQNFHAQVAMLEEVEDSAFQGNPHYGHDLSFEADQTWCTQLNEPPLQLSANVENLENYAPYGVQYAHYLGNSARPTNADLSKEYNNLIIWRNKPGTGKSNIEQWGTLHSADYDVPSEMNSELQPNAKGSAFSLIQIALFGGYTSTPTSPFLLRTGVSAADAQMGMLNVHVGITKKSDFNIDYRIDSLDARILSKHWNTSDSATIRRGDATNDGIMDISDANPLIAFWSKKTLDYAASGTYNPINGVITLNLKNISTFKITGPSGCFVGATPDLVGVSFDAFTDSDTLVGGFTSGMWTFTKSLGDMALKNLKASDFTLNVNFKGSGLQDGISVKLDGSVLTQHTATLFQTRYVQIGQEQVVIPSVVKEVDAMLVDLSGRIVWRYTGPLLERLDLPSYSGESVQLLRMADLSNGRVILQTKRR